MKKLITLFLCIATSISIILSGALSVCAAPAFVVDGFGTEEDGIIPPISFYTHYHNPYTETNGFPNADFEKGLMYWTQGRKLKPADLVDIVEEENGNHYLTFTCNNPYEGIDGIRFVDSRVKVGDNLVVVYDWRGEDPNFQVALVQYMMNADGSSGTEVRLSHNGDAKTQNFLFATEENDWNVSFNKVQNPVAEPTRGDSTIYLSYMVQVCSDPTNTSHIDNIRLAIHNETSGILYDLDGKVMYDLNDLPVADVEDTLEPEDFEGIDFDAKNPDASGENEELTTGLTKEEDTKEEDKKSVIESYNMFSAENWQGSDWWKPAVATGAIVIVVAGIAVAVILVVISKKKKAAAAVEQPEATEETEDNTDQNIIE